ncbi:MAG: ATP synthase F1 subunit gamma [Armatimonadota bacterium]
MASMRDIRRRIRTARNIQQITKALQMVAAARLQRAQSRAAAARPYAHEMTVVMGHLAAAGIEIEHPLLEVREPANIAIVLITSDRGMAGSYNVNVIRTASELAASYDKSSVKFVTVGRKGRMFLARRGFQIAADFPMPSSEVNFADARDVSRTVQNMFESREVDRVIVVYTRFLSAVSHRVTSSQLLPIAPVQVGETVKLEEYIFEPAPQKLLASLLPRYVDNQIYEAMLESLASEHGARMTAMRAATDNASEMIDRLTLDFNRARQAAITKEIAEIVSGAEALK